MGSVRDISVLRFSASTEPSELNGVRVAEESGHLPSLLHFETPQRSPDAASQAEFYILAEFIEPPLYVPHLSHHTLKLTLQARMSLAIPQASQAGLFKQGYNSYDGEDGAVIRNVCHSNPVREKEGKRSLMID